MFGGPCAERTRTMAVACAGWKRNRASPDKIPARPGEISGSELPGGGIDRIHSLEEIRVWVTFLLVPGHAGLNDVGPPAPGRSSSTTSNACCFTVPHLILADGRAHGVQPRNTMRRESGQTAGLDQST